MIITTPGYRGHKLWSVSLDGADPVTVKAPSDSVAKVRACIYYGLDWLKESDRARLNVWSYGHD